MFQVLLPLALVAAAVGLHQLSGAVPLALHPLALVRRAVRVDERTAPVRLALERLALVGALEVIHRVRRLVDPVGCARDGGFARLARVGLQLLDVAVALRQHLHARARPILGCAFEALLQC